MIWKRKKYEKIIKNGQGEYIEKKSKFIAHIFNVESEQQAAAIIAEVKRNTGMPDITVMPIYLGIKGRYRGFQMMESRLEQQENQYWKYYRAMNAAIACAL